MATLYLAYESLEVPNEFTPISDKFESIIWQDGPQGEPELSLILPEFLTTEGKVFTATFLKIKQLLATLCSRENPRKFKLGPQGEFPEMRFEIRTFELRPVEVPRIRSHFIICSFQLLPLELLEEGRF